MAVIYLHNTLSGKKETFKPLRGPLFGALGRVLGRPSVGMYHCGPTVYNYIHIGNLRSFFLTDTLRRMFEANGYRVKQVVNITDVGLLESDNAEDKMTQALKREGKPLTLEAMHELAEFYAAAFVDDLKALNIQIPHKLPRASAHIPEDIAVIRKLEKKGLTYRIADGIYFDTSKIDDYGKLGGVAAAGPADAAGPEQSRIGVNAEKRNPRDFALWKFNEDLGWQSPWGKGFPGWHIECSAMSMKYLGESFDIHTGGIDLIPIHHNNEIAQSEHATCQPFARYWLHNAFVNVGNAKMAKSAGNFLTLRSLVEKGHDPLAYRYFLLNARYSTPLDFNIDLMDSFETAYGRLRAAVNGLPDGGKIDRDLAEKALSYAADDLDTPKILALVWDILKGSAEKASTLSPADKKATIIEIDKLLGLKLGEKAGEIPKNVLDLAAERDTARKNKNWKHSDELRGQIAGLGYEVKDTPEGQTIRKI